VSDDGPRFGGGDELVAIQDLEPGMKIRLRGDVLAEVSENPRDGMWIVVRYLETPAGPVSGERIELASADDVLGRVEK
jgi:hypothetical protein